METKCLEVRDKATFCPVICIRPVPINFEQRYLLRRDGYSGTLNERCIIYIAPQCRGVNYDAYHWADRTHQTAHVYIENHWNELRDGDVIDVEFILGETETKKTSERNND